MFAWQDTCDEYQCLKHKKDHCGVFVRINSRAFGIEARSNQPLNPSFQDVLKHPIETLTAIRTHQAASEFIELCVVKVISGMEENNLEQARR